MACFGHYGHEVNSASLPLSKEDKMTIKSMILAEILAKTVAVMFAGFYHTLNTRITDSVRITNRRMGSWSACTEATAYLFRDCERRGVS